MDTRDQLYPNDQPQDASAAAAAEPASSTRSDRAYPEDQPPPEEGKSPGDGAKPPEQVSDEQKRFQETQVKAFSQLITDWGKQARGDRELGGGNWKETNRLAAVALQAGGAGSAKHEARQLLNESGLGNHPTMIRLFRSMGAEIDRLRRQSR